MIWRGSSGLAGTAWGTAKAALAGVIPDALVCVLWAAKLYQPAVLDFNVAPFFRGGNITLLSLRFQNCAPNSQRLAIEGLCVMLALISLQGLILGFAGAMLGRLAVKLNVRRGLKS